MNALFLATKISFLAAASSESEKLEKGARFDIHHRQFQDQVDLHFEWRDKDGKLNVFETDGRSNMAFF